MFNWFKKKHTVEFYTPVEDILIDGSIMPYPNKKDMGKILKNVAPSTFEDGNSIKNCPGIVKYLKQGFIIPAWQDIAIETNGDGNTFEWKNNNCGLQNRVSSFFAGYSIGVKWQAEKVFFQHFPRDNTLKTVIKFDTPWLIKLPPGYSALFLPVYYDNEERFSVIPGILETDYYGLISIQVYWHRLNSTEIIKAGTPLMKIIPFKNEDWDHIVRLGTEKEAIDYNRVKYFNRYMFNGSMKRFQNMIDNAKKKSFFNFLK